MNAELSEEVSVDTKKTAGIAPIKLERFVRFNPDIHQSLAASLSKRLKRFSSRGYKTADDLYLLGDIQDPMQFFALTERVINEVDLAEKRKKSSLTEDELLNICLEDTEGTISPDFTSGAINSINALYYQSSIAFSNESGLASMFVENNHLNIAVANLIRSLLPSEMMNIRIKELSSGAIPSKWIPICNVLSDKAISVILTDFSAPAVPSTTLVQEEAPNATFSTEEYSLFDHMNSLPPSNQVDVMFTTYGFDSVWLDEDVRYNKTNGKWFKVKYRVKVLDSHPHKDAILQALRAGEIPSADLGVDDFKNIAIEEAVEEIDDISKVPHGEIINADYKDKKNVSVNFPGGLIARVVEAFTNQLSDDGVFIIGDVAKYSDKNALCRAYNTSGIAAKYKIEDYGLAKEVLEKKYGFSVEILSLEQLADTYLEQNWQVAASETHQDQIMKNPQTCIMIVKRNLE